MAFSFMKISATGNDFVAIDNWRGAFPPEAEVVRKICARRLGVGADGILLLEKSPRYHFAMRYFNADGSEGELCGNGARAIALFAYLTHKLPRNLTFESQVGTHQAIIASDGVKVQMPGPQNMQSNLQLSEKFGYKSTGFVEIGVPHFVVEVQNLDTVDVLAVGKSLRYDPAFASGTNVDFFEQIDRHTISMRTYERGVEDETMACGTGATAVVLLNFLRKRVESPVTVSVRGGELTVEFTPDFSQIFLQGAVQPIYSGQLFLENREWMRLNQLEKSFRTQKG